MKKTFRRFFPGTLEYVVEHGRYMASIGKNPSLAYEPFRNPRVALSQAVRLIEHRTPVHFMVVQGGWLKERHRRELAFTPDRTMVHEAIRKAAAGRDPGYYDNSVFYRVDPRYAGHLVTVYLNAEFAILTKIESVYLQNGTVVEMFAGWPLSYARWGKRRPGNLDSPRLRSWHEQDDRMVADY